MRSGSPILCASWPAIVCASMCMPPAVRPIRVHALQAHHLPPLTCTHRGSMCPPPCPQASQLTSLRLVGPWPEDASVFFGHLVYATQLRHLGLYGWSPGCLESFLSPECFQEDPAYRRVALARFGTALAALTNLTCLKLNALELAARPGAPNGGLAVLPCLAELDVSPNSCDPAAGMRALPFGLAATRAVVHL